MRDYSLHADSWCVDNSCCGQVGAMGQGGCGYGGCGAPQAAPISERFGESELRVFPDPWIADLPLRCTLPGPASGVRALLSIHDLAGRRVRVLFDGCVGERGLDVQWDGLRQDGRPVSSGVYYCRLRWSGEASTKRVLVVR